MNKYKISAILNFVTAILCFTNAILNFCNGNKGLFILWTINTLLWIISGVLNLKKGK